METKEIHDVETIKYILMNLDENFYRGLLHRINNVDEYAKKLSMNSRNLIAVDNGQILGFIFFYCNDLTTQISYISQLCVSELFRKKGIGTLLLDKCKEISKLAKMKEVDLEVSQGNVRAISFYKKNGFTLKNLRKDYNSYIMGCLL